LLALRVLVLFLPRRRGQRVLRSFPTRRSSDLGDQLTMDFKCLVAADEIVDRRAFVDEFEQGRPIRRGDRKIRDRAYPVRHLDERSEEHTSELQSRFDLVCRLLLEKKKNKKTNA